MRLRLAMLLAVAVSLAGVAAGMYDGADNATAAQPSGWTWGDR
jgi:hypothetical protein